MDTASSPGHQPPQGPMLHSHDRIEIKKRLCATAWLLLIAAVTGGCVTGGRERERYFAIQAFAIDPTAGDGSARIAAWPMPAGMTVSQAEPLGTSADAIWPEATPTPTSTHTPDR